MTREVHRNTVDRIGDVPTVAALAETAQRKTEADAPLIETVRGDAGDVAEKI